MANYVIGMLVVLAVTAPAAWAATIIRGRLLPGWSGAPATLASTVLWLGFVVTVPTLLGGFGLLRRLPLVIAGVTVPVLAVRVVGAGRAEKESPAPVPKSSAPARAAACAICAVFAGPWLVWIAQTYRFGSSNFDSLNYHLPFAARWAQTGSTWHIQQVVPGLIVPYHPAAAEILHAVGMVAFHTDVVSPMINVGWLLLLALGGWCLGAPQGRAPHSMALIVVMADCPLMIGSQPGSAMTDLALVAVCVAAVALLVNSGRASDVAVPIGVALGLAAGIKLDGLAPAAIVALGMIVLARNRMRTAMHVVVPALAIGGFWYVRDLVTVGNPVPGLNIGLFPKVSAPIDEAGGFSVAHYVTDPTVIHRFFIAGLAHDFGRLWPAWIAVAAIGGVGAVIRGPTPAYRVAGAVAIGAVIAYALTPTSAFGAAGSPTFFVYNVRYAMPGLVAGAGLLPTSVSAGRRSGPALLAVAAVLAVSTLLTAATWPASPHISISWIALGWPVAIGLAMVAAIGAMFRLRVRSALVAGVATAAVIGAVAQVELVPREYTRPSIYSPALAWGRTVHHSRIGYVALEQAYPLVGADLSNRVQYLGVAAAHHGFVDAPSCATLRRLLVAGRYRYVVFARDYRGEAVPTADSWIRGAAGATQVLSSPSATAYRLSGTLDAASCP